MLIFKLTQPAAKCCISKDATTYGRPAMRGVFYDAERQRYVVSDGHVMVWMPSEGDDTDSAVFPMDAMPTKTGSRTEVTQTEDKKVYQVIEYDKKNAQVSTRIVKVIEEQYPNYQAILDTMPEEQPIPAIALNLSFADAFVKVATALGGLPMFTLKFTSEKSMVKVTHELFEGLWMPVRTK